MTKTFLAASALVLASYAYAQAPTTAKKVIDGGVTPVRLIDRAEVRVIRTEIQPHTTRAVHTHDDVKFHLFLPLTPGLELTIGSDKPVMTEPGQAYFIMKSTPHTFRNTTGTLAMTYEVFIKDGPAAAAMDGRKPFDLAQVLTLAASGNK
jgi:quercetin dioxygenase-like cupin family protein